MATGFLTDSVWVNCSTTGLTDFTTTTALPAYRTPAAAAIPNGSTIHYSARTATEFENGEGVYNSATGVITRVTIYASSNAGAKVNFATSPTLAVAPLAVDIPIGVTDGDKTDITVSGSGATWTIDANAVTNAKMASMVQGTFKARYGAGPGDPQDLTGTQAVQLLPTFNTVDGGIVPTSPGGTASFLRADTTWAVPPTGGVTDGDKTDITVSGGGATWVIDPGVVSNAKLASMTQGEIKGRIAAGTGDPQNLTSVQVTSMMLPFSSTLQGVVTASGGGSTNFLCANGNWQVPPGTGAPTTRTLTAGAGMTGGGDLTLDRTFNVIAGTGITVNADDVALDTAHARNVDHSAVTLTAGSGLTGGGTIAASRTFDIGGSTSVIVGADDVQRAALTGEVTAPQNSNATTITAAAVTNAKLANMNQGEFKARTSAGAGVPQDVTSATATSMMLPFTSSLQGVAPASGGGAVNYLRADGTWNAPQGAGNVVGPASATDNAIARFDGTTGRLIQDSPVTVEDNGNITSTSPTSTGSNSIFLYASVDGVGYAYLDFSYGLRNPSAATPNKTIFSFGAEGNYSSAGVVSGHQFYIWDSNASTYRLRVDGPTGSVSIPTTVASTTPTSGALIVAGGLGVSGNVHAGGSLNASAGATLIGTAASLYVDFSGGGHTYLDQSTIHFRTFGLAEYAGMNATALALAQTTASTTPTSGALTVAGGVGVSGSINVGGDVNVTGRVNVTGIIAAIGGKVSFPATQIPDSDPNTLDDYREGTFTPTLTIVAGTPTYPSATGAYIKIGKQVTVWIDIPLTSRGGGTGNVEVTNMPFTAETGEPNGFAAAGVSVLAVATITQTYCQVLQATTRLILQKLTGTTGVQSALLGSDINDSSRIRTTITYRTSA